MKLEIPFPSLFDVLVTLDMLLPTYDFTDPRYGPSSLWLICDLSFSPRASGSRVQYDMYGHYALACIRSRTACPYARPSLGSLTRRQNAIHKMQASQSPNPNQIATPYVPADNHV